MMLNKKKDSYIVNKPIIGGIANPSDHFNLIKMETNPIQTISTRLVYPKYDIYADSLMVRCNTYLRKYHKDKWYLIPIRSEFTFGPYDPNHGKNTGKILTDHEYPMVENARTQVNMVLERFLTEVYKAILFYIVDPDRLDIYGNHIIFIDEDQRSEEERLNIFL